jgi:hypothetical protein
MASRTILLSSLLVFAPLLTVSAAVAQEPAPPSQAFPPPAPPQAQPAQPPPVAQPAPSPAQPAPYPAQPAGPQPYPQPQYPPPPQNQPPSEPGYGYSQPYAEPPPPPSAPGEGFQRPEISIRVDPLNMLFEERLGLQLEVQLWHFITFELTPVFVIGQKSPTLNYFSSFDNSMRQHSNGLGAISGAQADVAFWFNGKPFRDYGLRVGLADYGYKYDSTDDAGEIDHATQTQRQFVVMLTSMDRWGAFTLGFDFGITYELDQKHRCLPPGASNPSQAVSTGCTGFYLATERLQTINAAGQHLPGGPYTSSINLNSFVYPFDLVARISLGVTF